VNDRKSVSLVGKDKSVACFDGGAFELILILINTEHGIMTFNYQATLE